MGRLAVGSSARLVIMAALSLAGLLGCSRPEATPPSVVLITLDAVHADHLGCYGSDRVETPAIDSLAAEGVRFTDAWSTSSWTAPAMASLFSGVYSRSHAVRHGFFDHQTLGVFAQEPLAESVETLAERFKARGYATVGVSTNPHLRTATGFAQGFDHFTHVTFKQALDPRAELTDALIEQVMIDAETTTELALEIIDRLPEGRPYFLWVHYLDPHWPYFPKQPWMADYFGERDRPDVLQLTDDPLYGRDIVRQREAFEIEQGSTVLEYLIACYDSEISFTDRAVGELLGRLPGAEDAVVVLTADHGEAFLEHDNLGHRSSLYREEVRVPLILRAPDGRWAGETRRDTVSLLDLYPTLVELAGDPPATPAAQRGESLLRVLDGRQRLSPVFAELTDLDGRDQVAVGDGRYKLIVPCQGCAPELYDVRADPAERRNLAGSEREARQHLEQLLAEWFDAVEWTEPGAPAQEVAPDIRRQLESLGYLDR